jgi:hypothetical protein
VEKRNQDRAQRPPEARAPAAVEEGQLDESLSGCLEDSGELGQVAFDEPAAREMLENEIADHGVRDSGLHPLEPQARDNAEVDVFRVNGCARALDHRGRDVDRDDPLEALC